MTPEATEGAKPYRGPLSYEIEDADYFFGRDREADFFTARILSSRFTLLHAQSGTGKTSLLNARVIPALEEQGWTAFRVLPSQNPSEEVRLGVLLGLLPPPAAECAVLDRMLGQFFPPDADPTLSEILALFDDEERTPKSDPRRRASLLPVQGSVNVRGAALSYAGSLRPLFLRVLHATLEVSQYEEHLRTMLPEVRVNGGTRAGELRSMLQDPAAAAAHEDLLARLYIPVPSLLEFFTNLFGTYGARRTAFRMVLILDQFEQLFTLFADSMDSPDGQRWRLRWEFIDQLETLYRDGSSLPLRYVISMRDEYIAQLDPLRRFVRDLDASAFHLSFLEKQDARACIAEPARLFRYEYSEDCFTNIFDVLLREDRFVEPAPLQIVCERLWRDQGKALSLAADSASRVVTLASFPSDGTRAILDSFFDEVLASFTTESDRLEALEILEPLVTANRTRNILERDCLVNAPFRKTSRRTRLLEILSRHRVVRVEQRLGGQFVEITHEFLIPSILAKIRTVLNADPVYSRFRWAIRTLERFEDIDFRAGSSNLLARPVFQELNQRRDEIDWEGVGREWSKELMFRTAIALLPPNPATAQVSGLVQPNGTVDSPAKETLRYWAGVYRSSGVGRDLKGILSEVRLLDPARGLLSLEELAFVNSEPGEDLSAEQIEFVFRSQIQRGSTHDRDNLKRWTRELRRICASETRS